MGDGDDGALVVGEVALEPLDRLGVEVVGRLVEQQQVGLAQQQPAERDAAALAARERARPPRPPAGSAARPSRARSIASRFQASAASICVLQPRELVGGLVGVVGRELVEALEERASSPTPSSTLPRTSLAGSSARLLLEQADGRARARAGRRRGTRRRARP